MSDSATSRQSGVVTAVSPGDTAMVEPTGVRDPCARLETNQKGLMKATLDRDADGNLIRKTGVMSIVRADGEVPPGDTIRFELPPEPLEPPQPV